MNTLRTALRRNRPGAGDDFARRHRRVGTRDGFAGMVRRLARAMVAAAGWLRRLRRNRRATLDLLDLDAERLADIGLTRADVHAALFDPRTPDPTGMLDALAAERRTAGRRR